MDAAAVEVDPVQHGWLVHQAVQTWTNQSETKATILLPVESALFVFFGGRFLTGGIPEEQKITETGGLTAAMSLGLLLMFYGVGCLLLSVVPRLRRRELRSDPGRNAIYFGHMNGRDPTQIKDALEDPDLLDQLARQLSSASTIAWKKHRWLQASMIVFAAGLTLVVASYVVANFLV